MDYRIAIGSDHGGFELKSELVKYLGEKGCHLTDVGTHSLDSCDYPDYCFQVAENVQSKKCDRGIVICTTGIGASICANKVAGVRAALCLNTDQAELTRQHNDANVLALAAKYVSVSLAKEICDMWLLTAFEGGRHQRRIDKITEKEV